MNSSQDPKKNLCKELSSTIKVIQEDHVLTKQVKGGHFAADQLCDLIEAIFLHELKDRSGELWRDKQQLSNSMDLPEPSFWSCIDPLVSDEIKMQLLALRNSDSSVKKCRSWVRLMLVKGLLVSFLNDVQKHPGLLGPHYGSGALLKDPEYSEIVLQLLKGLQVFEFEYDFTSPRLVSWEARVLQLACIWTPPEARAPIKVPNNLKKKQQISNSPRSYDDKISPPPSDFLIEEAMDKYSVVRRSMNDLTDDQILEEERQDSLTDQTLMNKRVNKSTVPPTGRPFTSDFSYQAMLHSYARKVDKPMYAGSGEGPQIIEEDIESSFDNIETSEVPENKLQLAQDMNFEVVSVDDFISPKTRDHIETLTSLLTHLEREKGLDVQDYQCAGCTRPIGIVFGEAKLCKFDGHHYCYECHLDDERVVPARVLFNWDFRKHRVCVRSCEFLDSIEISPVLNIEETNRALYHYIPELEQAKKFRQLLSFQKDYILTCKNQNYVDEFKKRVRSSHFYESIHLYSIKDLKQVYNGTLLQRLRKIVRNASKHIRNCSICSQKGFICEVCQKDEILFPFDEDTYQCAECKSVYHWSCKPKLKSQCQKCLRLEQRRASLKRCEPSLGGGEKMDFNH